MGKKLPFHGVKEPVPDSILLLGQFLRITGFNFIL